MNREKDLLRRFRAGLMPPRKMSVVEWAESNIVLTTKDSAMPGPWLSSRVPFVREPMEACAPGSGVQMVIIQKASQVTMTTAMLAVMFYYMEQHPCPMIYTVPGDGAVRKMSTGKISVMIRASPALNALVDTRAGAAGGNSLNEKHFPGGTLHVKNTVSPETWRSVPARVVQLDEFSGVDADIGGEGDPVVLAKGRVRTFPEHVIIAISTPTVEGACLMEAAYLETSQKRFFVPCPHCGHEHTLELENLVFAPGRDGAADEAHMKCPKCAGEIHERMKPRMFASGKWRDTAPEKRNPKVWGGQISAFYSPLGMASWADLGRQWHDSEGTPSKEKAFFNTVLGLPYREKGDTPPWEALYNRRGAYMFGEPPESVCLLTCGVDVQGDRLEAHVLGFGMGGETWVVDYRVFAGDVKHTGQGSAWAELTGYLKKPFRRADGMELRVSRTCVDSGDNTLTVYAYCAGWGPDELCAVKGLASQKVAVSQPRLIDKTDPVSGVAFSGVRLHTVGTDMMKSHVYSQLRLSRHPDGGAPSGYWNFPQSADVHFFKGLTSESLTRTVSSKGVVSYAWVKNYTRNEPLDTAIYGLAAFYLTGAHTWTDEDWRRLDASLSPPVTMAAPSPVRRRPTGGYWGA